MEWAASLDDGEWCQYGSDRPILLFLAAKKDSQTASAAEKVLSSKRVGELLTYYCRVRLSLEDFAATARSIGISQTPALVLIGPDPSRPIESRMMGFLENLESEKRVAAFLEASLKAESPQDALESISALAQIGSATELLDAADKAREAKNLRKAYKLVEAASAAADPGNWGLLLLIHIKRADMAYEAGEFIAAIDSYRRALQLLRRTGSKTDALRLYDRLALLLNDQMENEAALKAMDEAILLAEDPKRKKELLEARQAMEGSLFVLAARGYPGVTGWTDGVVSEAAKEEDLGDPALSFEDRLKKVQTDLDGLAGQLGKWFEDHKRFPDTLTSLGGAEGDSLQDPFFHESRYRYLHFEDPEDYVLYSIGPDGKDQSGEVEYDPSQGPSGEGDIVRRFLPAAGGQ